MRIAELLLLLKLHSNKINPEMYSPKKILDAMDNSDVASDFYERISSYIDRLELGDKVWVDVSGLSRHEYLISLLKSAWPDCEIANDIWSDAARFLDAFNASGSDMIKPEMWCADGEIAFEWIADNKHAIASFDGDGTFGYAMLVNGRFVPGAVENGSPDHFPADLAGYLSSRL